MLPPQLGVKHARKADARLAMRFDNKLLRCSQSEGECSPKAGL